MINLAIQIGYSIPVILVNLNKLHKLGKTFIILLLLLHQLQSAKTDYNTNTEGQQIYKLLINFLLCLLVATCENQSLRNGQISYNKLAVSGVYPVNTTASFQCNSGYYLKGLDSVICEANGSSIYWNSPIPHCIQSN